MIFEGDSEVVIQAIKADTADQSMYGHIVDDILHQTAQMRFSDFCHVKRICNKVADALAKNVNVGLDFQVWLEDILRDIIRLALADVS